MILREPRTPLALSEVPDPVPHAGQLRVRVRACGVCRTDLHVVDGELPDATPAGRFRGTRSSATSTCSGAGVAGFALGDRVGVPWLGHTCGACRVLPCGTGKSLRQRALHRLHDRRRLCGATPWPTRATASRCPADLSDIDIAPWLCAGLIGYRALRMAGEAQRLGIYGFGAAAHIVAQVARYEGRRSLLRSLARAMPRRRRSRARSARHGPATATAGAARAARCGDDLRACRRAGARRRCARRRKGGIVVCAGIHMSDIPSFPYAMLWGERRIVSVANLDAARRRSFHRACCTGAECARM